MRSKKIIFIFLLLSFLFSCGYAEWKVSEGKFSSGFSLNTGNFLTNFKPGVNFDLVKYQISAKNALKEGTLVETSGKKGRWSWGANIQHFTGIKVNGFAGVGGNVTFEEKYKKQNEAIRKEKAKSSGIQEVETAAYSNDLKSIVTDKNGNPVVVPGVAILRKGNTKFGWTHISYDRPDGTNHARELKEVYNLPDQDQSVKDLIVYAIETGERKLQVREVDGKIQKRWVYTKVIDGKPMKVIVDGPGSQYEGSIITAYPTKYRRDRHKNDDKTYDIPSAEKLHSGYRKDYFVGASAGFNAFAGTEITGNGHITYTDKNGVAYSFIPSGYAQAGLMADGLARVGIENGSAVAGVSGDLFAGVRVGGSLTGQVAYKDMSASVTGYGRVGVGVGIKGTAKVKFGWDGISWDVNGGAYLGLGGEVGLRGSINWGKALDPVKNKVVAGYSKFKNGMQNIAKKVKKGFSEFKNRVTAFSGNISKTIKKLF